MRRYREGKSKKERKSRDFFLETKKVIRDKYAVRHCTIANNTFSHICLTRSHDSPSPVCSLFLLSLSHFLSLYLSAYQVQGFGGLDHVLQVLRAENTHHQLHCICPSCLCAKQLITVAGERVRERQKVRQRVGQRGRN